MLMSSKPLTINRRKDQASYETGKKYFLKDIKDHFGKNTLLVNIRYYNLEKYRNYLKQKPTKTGTKRKDSSINRPMACLKHLFSKAVEWDMIEQSPFTKGKSLLLRENNERTRFLSEDEISKLLNECSGYLRNVVQCALNTGMRKAEILSLRWEQIRNGFVYLRKTKTNQSREIPVSDDLKTMFSRIRKEQHLTSDYIFLYEGKPMQDVKSSFKGALRRAGIEDFCFHDLRHTFASLVIMRGGSLRDVQSLLGHKSLAMTLRYSHLTSDHRLKAVNLLNGLTCHKVDTNVLSVKSASM